MMTILPHTSNATQKPPGSLLNLSDEQQLLRLTPAWLPLTIHKDSWQFAPHLRLLNEKLTLLVWGHIKRLMILMPPRHGKSQFASYYLPSWYIGTFPDRNVILTSYSAEYAAEYGRKVRDLLTEYGEPVFGLKPRFASKAADHLVLDHFGGGMTTAGAGGSLTGRGAHLLVIDDPIKNAQEAASATYRQATWEWYRSTVYTRLQPGNSAMILIQTRWHEDDLAGRLLAEMRAGGPQWEVLSLPAIAEDDDQLGRAPGQPLWPEQFGLKELDEIQRTLGSQWWYALYQQRPQPAGGGIFKREHFRYYQQQNDCYVYNQKIVPIRKCWNFTTVDLAVSERTQADYTVLGTWACTPDNDLLLLDVVRDHFEGTRHQALIHQAYQRWQPSFIGIEQVGYQLSLIQQVIKDGLPIRALRDQRDKIARALLAQTRYENGTIYHPVSAPWLAEFEEELLLFPRAAHDDQVDVTGYAALVAMRELGDVPFAATHLYESPLSREIRAVSEAKPTEADAEQQDLARQVRNARFLQDLSRRL